MATPAQMQASLQKSTSAGIGGPIFRWIILINLKPFSCSLACLIAFGCPRLWADPQYYIVPRELAMEMTDGDTLSDA